MLVLLLAAGVLLAVGGSHILARSYCRVHAVEEGDPALFVAARPIGIVVGALVWTALRLVTPEFSSTADQYGVLLNGAASFLLSAAVLTVFDVVVSRWIGDEPSYGESREALLEHGSCDNDGTDWMDAVFETEADR